MNAAYGLRIFARVSECHGIHEMFNGFLDTLFTIRRFVL